MPLIEAAERALRPAEFCRPVALGGEQQSRIFQSAAGKHIRLRPDRERAALSTDREAFDLETLRLQLDARNGGFAEQRYPVRSAQMRPVQWTERRLGAPALDRLGHVVTAMNILSVGRSGTAIQERKGGGIVIAQVGMSHRPAGMRHMRPFRKVEIVEFHASAAP